VSTTQEKLLFNLMAELRRSYATYNLELTEFQAAAQAQYANELERIRPRVHDALDTYLDAVVLAHRKGPNT